MLEILGAIVVLALVGPLLVVGAMGLLFLVAGIVPAKTSQVRETFRCPVTRRIVTADFLLEERANCPFQVSSCTAFRDPKRITCDKACRIFAQADWGPPRGIFPRWALTAGGLVTWREAGEPARAA